MQTTLPMSFEDNDNVTVPIGPVTLTRMVFRELELGKILSKLKRRQGASIEDVTIALVTHAMQMEGLSINRMEDILDNPHRREIYGLDEDVDKNDLYRTGRRLGESIDLIVEHLDRVLKDKFDISFEKVFMDWSATYIDGKPTDLVRFGHTKDHRPDRPQVAIGMVMEALTGLLCGLTVVSGNTNDAKHFRETFRQVRPFLDPKCLIVFDAGAYGEENGKLVTESGFDYLTRLQLSKTEDRYIPIPEGRWLHIDDDIRAYMFKGNNRRLKVLFYSKSRHDELIHSYRAKAERDYEEALELKAMVKKGKPRKKYVNSNSFLSTSVGYSFPLDMADRSECIDWAVKNRITGREGYFVLTSSRVMLPGDMLRIYRSRNRIEDAYNDLKHGIDIRPVRCTDEASVRGRVLIAYLALTVLSFSKYITPEIERKTAKSVIAELTSFSVTAEIEDKVVKRMIYSNFNDTIRAIMRGFERIPDRIRANRAHSSASIPPPS